MKIAVIGANGRSGSAFVAAALAEGYMVRAGFHKHNPFQLRSNLTVLQCDATRDDELAHLITGCDAVVSLIGHIKGSAKDVQTVATQRLIAAMEQVGIRRIVTLTGTGVRLPNDKISLPDRVLNAGVLLVDAARVYDGRKHVALLAASNLEWTVIRVLKLSNSRPKPCILLEHGPAKLLTSRQEVAQSILEVLRNDTFVRKAPTIGKV